MTRATTRRGKKRTRRAKLSAPPHKRRQQPNLGNTMRRRQLHRERRRKLPLETRKEAAEKATENAAVSPKSVHVVA